MNMAMKKESYSYGSWMKDLANEIRAVSLEISRIGTERNYTLQGQLKGYDLLEHLWLLDNFKEQERLVQENVSEEEYVGIVSILQDAIDDYRYNFTRYEQVLKECYDQDKMEAAAAEYMYPWVERVERAEQRLDKMKRLHALATKASEIFSGHNFIRKFFILKKLRKEAGFKLRRDRVGNFAAKTFDLVNEAQSDLNQTRNGLHCSNVRYKCIGDLYPRILHQLDMITGIILPSGK